jgi:hypothetical protein
MDKVKFTLGQTVYLSINAASVGMITGIVFRPIGVSYYVTWGDFTERSHYECELTDEKTYADESA